MRPVAELKKLIHREIGMLDYETLNELSERYGDSYYIFSPDRVQSTFRTLKQAFSEEYGDFEIAYALKGNYLPALCKAIDSLHGMAEVSSKLEYQVVVKSGILPSRVIYNGPDKDTETMREVLLSGGIVNIDAPEELEEIIAITSACSKQVVNVGIRCNFQGEDNRESRFGIDVSSDSFLRCLNRIHSTPFLRLECIHCHVKGRKIEDWRRRITNMLAVYSQIYHTYGIVPRIINLGGGLPAPDATGQRYRELATELALIAEDRLSGLPKPTLVIEPGTALAANSSVFVAKVKRIKRIGSKLYAVLHATSLQVNPLHRNRPPELQVYAKRLECNTESNYDLVGNTCLEDDVLLQNYRGHLCQGDYVVFQDVGAYSFVLKPPFITLNSPILAFEPSTRSYVLVKRCETPEDILNSYVI